MDCILRITIATRQRKARRWVSEGDGRSRAVLWHDGGVVAAAPRVPSLDLKLC